MKSHTFNMEINGDGTKASLFSNPFTRGVPTPRRLGFIEWAWIWALEDFGLNDAKLVGIRFNSHIGDYNIVLTWTKQRHEVQVWKEHR